MEKWVVSAKRADFQAIAEKFGIDQVTARLIRNRDIVGEPEIRQYLYGTKEDFYDPHLLKDADKLVEILMSKIKEQKKIRIIGDYDIDGVNASYILLRGLRHCHANADVEIPDRMKDGYGINETLIEGISDSLIITVDNGIAAVEPILAAKEAGNKIIVLDHHLPQETLPPADIIVDPHIHPEKNGYEDYCGAGLAYKLAEYLCAGQAAQEKKSLFFDLLVLACLGTLADVMPLTGDNRYLVTQGLRIINHDGWYPQLSSGLRAVLNLAQRPYDEDTIKFQIAPILNAAGRLYNAGSTSVLKALLSQDEAQAAGFAAKMQQINERRKTLVTQCLEQAQVAASYRADDPILIICCEGIPEGIIGILAGKLSEAYQKPAFVFSPIASLSGILKGSGRSYGDYDLFPLLQVVAPYVETAGGHTGAAGISVAQESYEEMAAAIQAYAVEHPPAEPDDSLYYDLELREEELPLALNELKALAPYGPGVEKPVLMVRDYQLLPKGYHSHRLMGRSNEHIKLFGTQSDAVGFHLSQTYQELGSPECVDLLGTVGENRFQGRTTLQFQFEAIRPSGRDT